MAFNPAFYRSMTIDNTKCGTADSTNFPIKLYGTYDGTGGEPDLRGTGSGGKIAQASAFDIAFYSDEALTTLLDFERISHNLTTGLVEYNIESNINGTGTGTDKVIYMAYNDGSATDQSNKNGTWEAGFKGVYHMEGNSNDSTSNARNGTDTGGITYSTTNGKFGQHADPDGSPATGRISLSTTGLPTGTNPISILMWLRGPNITSGGGRGAISIGALSGSDAYAVLIQRSINGGTNYDDFVAQLPTSWITAGANSSDDTWHRVGLYHSGSQIFTSFNGTYEAGGSQTLNLSYGIAEISGVLQIANRYWEGQIDEVYIYAGQFTESFFTADYNNHNSPDTFYTFGAETAVGGGASRIRFLGSKFIW